MTYDHLLPIFLQDKVTSRALDGASSTTLAKLSGGLGLTTQQVGLIMSVNGVIALFVQALIFPFLASWLGVYKLFVIVTIGHPLAYFIVPYLVVLPRDWLFIGIYTTLFVRNFFTIMAYPLLLILIKEAAPSRGCLGKINGLAASTGGACRTIASPVAGALYGMGSHMHFGPLAWWASAIVAILGALQVSLVVRIKSKTAVVRSAAAWSQESSEEDRAGREVEPSVQEIA
jgi:hypothetical protein